MAEDDGIIEVEARLVDHISGELDKMGQKFADFEGSVAGGSKNIESSTENAANKFSYDWDSAFSKSGSGFSNFANESTSGSSSVDADTDRSSNFFANKWEASFTRGLSQLIRMYLGFGMLIKAYEGVKTSIQDYDKAVEDLGDKTTRKAFSDEHIQSVKDAELAWAHLEARIGTVASSPGWSKLSGAAAGFLENFVYGATAAMDALGLLEEKALTLMGHAIFGGKEEAGGESFFEEWKRNVTGMMGSETELDVIAQKIMDNKKENEDSYKTESLALEKSLAETRANNIEDQYKKEIAQENVRFNFQVKDLKEKGIYRGKVEEDAARIHALKIWKITDDSNNKELLDRAAQEKELMAFISKMDALKSQSDTVDAKAKKNREEKTQATLEKGHAQREKWDLDEIKRQEMMLENARRTGDQSVNNLKALASAHKEFAGVYKAVAIAMAIWDTFASATAAYRSFVEAKFIPPPLNVILGTAAAATSIAAGMINVEKISSTSFQTDPGEVKRVPGGPNEEVPARLHGGELVGRPEGGSFGATKVHAPLSITINGNVTEEVMQSFNDKLQEHRYMLEQIFRRKMITTSRLTGLVSTPQ